MPKTVILGAESPGVPTYFASMWVSPSLEAEVGMGQAWGRSPLAELRIVSEWAQLPGTEASELPVPTGICKPCKSSPHGGLVAGTLVRFATPVASAMALAGLRPGEVRLALLAVVYFRRGLLYEIVRIQKGDFLTDLPPSGEA